MLAAVPYRGPVNVVFIVKLSTASQHRPPEGNRSEERKRPTFHPPRSTTICVQPGKYWHCVEGNLGETAERRGDARMGLSERYDELKLKLKTENYPKG